MIEAIRNEVRARGAELGLVGEPSVLQVGGASWRGGRIHFAVMTSNGRPALFARVTRNPGDESRLEREQALLSRLAASAEFSAHVPAPLFFARIDGRSVFCERAAVGKRLAGEGSWPRLGGARERMGVATSLAVSLARASTQEATRERFEALALEPLRRFWIGAGGRAADVDSALGAVMDAMSLRPHFIVTHGDFIAKNILVDPDGQAVLIDWETASEHGLPLLDLFYFITRAAYLAGPPWREKMDRVRRFYATEDGAVRDVARRAIVKYCSALGYPSALALPMYRLHFLYKARIKAETTSLDNTVTQAWLELFAESARPRPALLSGA